MVAIAAGGYDSLALLNNGTVVAWGNNGVGQTNVPPGLSNVMAIAAGGFHSLADLPRSIYFLDTANVYFARLGASTNLSVAVLSVSPFGSQWSFNGLPIAGATVTNLVISNFDLTKAGAYSVVVTNHYRLCDRSHCAPPNQQPRHPSGWC